MLSHSCSQCYILVMLCVYHSNLQAMWNRLLYARSLFWYWLTILQSPSLLREKCLRQFLWKLLEETKYMTKSFVTKIVGIIVIVIVWVIVLSVILSESECFTRVHCPNHQGGGSIITECPSYSASNILDLHISSYFLWSLKNIEMIQILKLPRDNSSTSFRCHLRVNLAFQQCHSTNRLWASLPHFSIWREPLRGFGPTTVHQSTHRPVGSTAHCALQWIVSSTNCNF